MRTLCVLAGVALVSLTAVACGGSSSEDDEGSGDLGELTGDEAELRSATITIPSGGSKAFTFTTQGSGSAVALLIDCSPPAGPDSVGLVFKIDAPALNLPASETPKAGAFAWSGQVAAGSHTVKVTSVSDSGRCAVKVGGAGSASCKSYKSYRSPNTNATHFAVGSETSSDWEPFPASGNHWGAWAPWNKAYTTPVKRPFLLHNLEHGGSVLSYKCESNTSTECADAEAKLKALVESMGLRRYLITPDPTQPEMFAVRTWRWVYTSSCLQDVSAKAFLSDHMRKGREDIDADPPIPFDPTTTNVPCQDLMAAPDSCY